MSGGGFWFFKWRVLEGCGFYFDGGFGVGKMYLLVSVYYVVKG